jgi:hypothetical protein
MTYGEFVKMLYFALQMTRSRKLGGLYQALAWGF